MQAKRIQAINPLSFGAAGQANVILNVPTSPREAVNLHNIWASFSVEPETAGANAQGFWVLFELEDIAQGVPVWSLGFINGETRNMNIIACGVWGASNEKPFTKEIHPTTSRTLEAGARLILSVHAHGVTTGNLSVICSLCAHSTRK